MESVASIKLTPLSHAHARTTCLHIMCPHPRDMVLDWTLSYTIAFVATQRHACGLARLDLNPTACCNHRHAPHILVCICTPPRIRVDIYCFAVVLPSRAPLNPFHASLPYKIQRAIEVSGYFRHLKGSIAGCLRPCIGSCGCLLIAAVFITAVSVAGPKGPWEYIPPLEET